MNKNKILFIAQFPPPIHGLSKAVETLYDSEELKQQFDRRSINTTDVVNVVFGVLKAMFLKYNLAYLTLAQTRMGNLRDLIFMSIVNLRKIKLVVHLHGGYLGTLVNRELPSWQRKWYFREISKVDKAIVLSKSLRNNFETVLSPDQIEIVSNCADDAYFASADIIANKVSRQSGDKSYNVLYLSNFIEEKGYKIVLQLAKLAKNDKRFFFNFAGKFYDQTEKQFFDAFVSENSLEDNVHYYGVVNGETKKRLLQEAHFFILPTKYTKEGSPISIMEAMANGNVVVSTNHAGIPDIVIPGRNGILFDTDVSAEQIFHYLKETSDTKWQTIAKNNYHDASQKFTEEAYIKNMMNLFTQR